MGGAVIRCDPHQLLLIWILCRLAQGAVLTLVWRIHQTFAPARDWALGALLAVPGLVLAALRDSIPDWASVVVANAFLLSGSMVFDIGIVRAAGRRPLWRCNLAVWAAAVLLLAVLSLLTAHYPTRVLVFTAAILFFDGQAMLACLGRERPPAMATTLPLIGGILGIQLASALLRAAGIVNTDVASLFAVLPTQIQYGYVTILTTFLVTPLLALLTSQKLQAELRELAQRDPLTMACNRRILDEVVANHWNGQDAVSMGCLLLDIDHFKLFNDAHGHQAGDAALVALSRAARSLLRAEDTWCRFGGEEFLALLPNTDARQAQNVAERLRATIAGLPLESPQGPTRITVSIGVATADAPTVSWPVLLGRCDRAMYRAKREGRDRVILDDTAASNANGRGFIRLAWNEAYACGLESIDAQHRQLFLDANELLTALLTGSSKSVCQERIEILLANVLRHFQDEEAVFRAAGYAGADDHVAIHRILLDKAHNLATRFAHGTLLLGELFDFLAMEVVCEHMLSEDRKFFPCLQDSRARNVLST